MKNTELEMRGKGVPESDNFARWLELCRLCCFKRGFQPTQRTQCMQRKERNALWRHYWISQSQPPATTVADTRH